MSTLDNAPAIACRAHTGQTDMAGAPYILHPIRLMMRFKHQPEQIVAVLHDSVEGSDLTLDDLTNAGFNSAIVAAIDSLTRRPGESYEGFIGRIIPNPLAVSVKAEDIRDNMDMDMTRLNTLTTNDHDRLDRYHRALRRLESRMAET